MIGNYTGLKHKEINIKYTYIACRNLAVSLILGLDFHSKFSVGTGWDED